MISTPRQREWMGKAGMHFQLSRLRQQPSSESVSSTRHVLTAYGSPEHESGDQLSAGGPDAGHAMANALDLWRRRS
jgi:hypothetical protein